MPVHHFSGLNLIKKKKDRFSFETNFDLNFNQIYFTFDNIYIIKDKIFKFEHENKEFNELNIKFEKILSACSNTNFFYILLLNEDKLNLIQVSGSLIVKEICLDHLKATENLLVIASDINLYIFENGNDVKCKFILINSENIDAQLIEQEKQLNENSLSSLPLEEVILNEKINQTSTGKEHCLLLTITGKVYSFGLGTKGQLGHGKIENCYTPKQITGLNKKIIFVDCGGWHSAAIDEENNVYLWGWNSSNQLGLVQEINSVFVSIPTILNILNEFTNRTLKFKKLSLGSRHSALVDLDNNLFTFGWNKYNQLFQDENEELEFEEPTKVFEFEKKVKDIKCGCWFTILTAN